MARMPSVPAQPQRHSLQFCKAFFEVHDGPSTHDRLVDAGAIEMSAPERGGLVDRWYLWREGPGSGTQQAAFLLRLRPHRMVLEGPTPAAVGRGWRELDKQVRPHATATVAAGDRLDRFLPRKRAHSGDRPESWSAEHENKVLAEFYAAFCHRWANTPHGLLDGRTPRQAADDESLAQRLESLLARMDHLEEERLTRGMASFSAQELRAAVFPGACS